MGAGQVKKCVFIYLCVYEGGERRERKRRGDEEEMRMDEDGWGRTREA